MKAYTKHRIIEGDGTKSKMDIDVDQGTQSLKLSIKTMPFIIAFENIDQFCEELKSLAAENKKSVALDRTNSNEPYHFKDDNGNHMILTPAEVGSNVADRGPISDACDIGVVEDE